MHTSNQQSVVREVEAGGLRDLSTTNEAANYLQVSTRQLGDWARGGHIRVTRLGKRLVRFHRNELERVAREGISE